MNKKKQKAEWDKVALWWDTEVGDTGAWHQRYDIDPVLLKMLGDIKKKTVLEIGCGNGYFARKLARIGAKVTASDISTKLIKLATKKEQFHPLGIKYLARDAAHLSDLKNGSFDIVVANMCLMDIKYVQEAILEVKRVLKSNSHFMFSITHPVFSGFYQQWENIKYKNKKYFARAVGRYLVPSAEKTTLWASGAKATHYRRPIESYVKFLKEAGFLIYNLREIATRKKVSRATLEDGDITFRRSKYRTQQEKIMKEISTKEIPLFLVVDAIKITRP